MNYIDVNGDSIMLTGENLDETIMMIYNGLENGTSIKMTFNNGVLDPNSIAEKAQNSSDFFLLDLYEIAVNPTMVELSMSGNNTYMMNGQKVQEEFDTPYDYDTRDDSPQLQQKSKAMGLPEGKGINGNLGQTLVPEERSLSGRYSQNKNVQIIINGRGSLNHRTVGLAHEFGHVILYLRNQYHGHSKDTNPFIFDQRATKMSGRLGYDY